MMKKRISRKSILKLGAMVLMLLGASSSFGQALFQEYKQLTWNGDGIEMRVNVNCDGPVIYSFKSKRDIRAVKWKMDGVDVTSGLGWLYNPVENDVDPDPTTAAIGYFYAKNQWYNWSFDFPNADDFCVTSLEFQYKQLSGSWKTEDIVVSYAHLGANPEFTVDFEATEVSTNNFEFTYTGTPITGLDVNSYSYSFNMDFGGTNSPVYQSSALFAPLPYGASLLPPGDSPHFYCKADVAPSELLIQNNLTVLATHSFESPLFTNQTLTCPYPKTKGIVLTDLCSLFEGFDVNNVGPNAEDGEIQTSSCIDPDIEAMVTYDLQVNSTSISNVGLDQLVSHTFPTGSNNIDELITIEPGCVCSNGSQYNTANPCYQMSPITTSFVFENGEYVYTIAPSQYTGSAGETVASISIDYGDGTSDVDNSAPFGPFQHAYSTPGPHNIVQETNFNGWSEPCEKTNNLTAEVYCCTNFAPESDTRYWVSAWVKEDHPTQQLNYSNASIQLSFSGGTPETVNIYTSGDIIEGWQRIVGEFTVPAFSTEMEIHLVNSNQSIDTYFDDVRIHPFNASMKSYVYDPETLWLTAELDDNNYATFYEYDNEGQLVRIKKETARGIMTIQESRSNNPKQD